MTLLTALTGLRTNNPKGLGATLTEEQSIAVLKEHEAGPKTADLAHKHGISEATIYNWKAKFGGMDVSEAKRLGPWRRRTGS